MNTHIELLTTLRLLLLAHERLMLVVLFGECSSALKARSDGATTDDEINDGSPAIAVVDVVTEPRSVNHRELDLELLLLELGLDDV